MRAYLNGEFIPAAKLSIPVWDTGFVQGVTVAEQLRTFGGQLFRLDQHLDRLFDSLRVIGVDPGRSRDELIAAACELVAMNHARLQPGDDLGLSIFVTPGPYAAFAPPDAPGPTVAMHTYPLHFASFARKYTAGERLATTAVEQVPATCWPTALKCRSRMHYYLADRQAKLVDPNARALMRDGAGAVTEASTANLILFRRTEGLVSPPREMILPGISVATFEELAQSLAVPFVFRVVELSDVATADEVFLSSTSPCLLPVVALNRNPIGTGQPGEQFRRLIRAWNSLVGIDIVAQAERFTTRDSHV